MSYSDLKTFLFKWRQPPRPPAGGQNQVRRFSFLLSKYALLLMTLITLLLLAISVYLGYISADQMRRIIKEDFNQQQLMLARHTANILEQDIDFLKRELITLNFSAAVEYLEPLTWANRLRVTLSSVREDGVVEIRRLNREGSRAYLVDERGVEHIIAGTFQDEPFFIWAADPRHKGQVYIQPVSMNVPNFNGRLIMIMATPTYELSADESHPQPSGEFSGVLAFYIDAHRLAKKFSQNITSGKSGYAWIMDSQGTFLNHPERSFIGQNAFTVRKERMPAISFDAINEIQRQKMLAGQEGWGEYISGWHKGLAGVLKKLIAYAPVRLLSSEVISGEKNPYFWSVAVVAPASEVEGVIHSVYFRQFFLQVIIGFFVLLGAIFMLHYRYERQFTVSLEEEVERQQKELQKKEEQYKALVENAADLIYTVDLDGRILSMNRYATKLFAQQRPVTAQAAGELESDPQVNPDIFIGKNLFDLMSPRSAEFHLEWMAEMKKTGKIISKRHTITIGEREFWFSTSIVGLKDEEGNIYAFEIISRDVTGRKALEDRLINMEKLASVGTLAAGVAHEINNPIAVILGFNEILLEQTAHLPEIHETLQIIEEEGLKCKRIVENLLTFARSPERTETTTDLNETLTKLLTVVKNTLLTKKIRLESEITPNLPRVQGDPQELQQVFINLINNAMAAMKGGGILSLRTRLSPSGKRVEVIVEDTGSGIPKKDQSRIFDPFFTTKKVGEGTGLGLSVSYGIIKKIGGDITFVSYPAEEYPEKHGTIFTVHLPVAGPETKSPTPETQGA
ncbi:MAG: ATP-binding protein [Desulfobacca sp.]|uniref:ATP-binding protein n=1 Tax=Desulfobacca sp. TaxID=2067990 RepID=UPI0040494861